MHVAVGYPGLKFLPDLQRYRETYRDYRQVVNAYEPHEHIYEQLHCGAGHGAWSAAAASSPPGCCSG